MKSEVKKIDNTKREINIEVSGDIVKNKFEDVFKKIAKDAKVPGFRQGNVPRDILEKNFSSHVHEEVLRELIPDVYSQALEKEGLEVMDLPDISDVKLDRGMLSFKATVEVMPEIKLKDYKKIKIHYGKIEITPDEVKRNIDTLKENRKLDAIDNSLARGMGYPDLAELEKAMERQIYIQKEYVQRQKLENEIIQGITKDLDFQVPKNLVKRQLQDMLRQAKLDLALKGLPRERIDAEEANISKELEPEAKKQAEVYLILSQIAKKENIPLDEHMPRRVMEFLLKEADWQEGA